MCDPFGWQKLDRVKFAEIRKKLTEFEKLTWNEILVANQHKNHTVRRDKLSKDARDRLTALQLDDQEDFVSLRLTGVERVWGIRIEGAMTLIWWDPNHLVCPSLKKHT